METYNDLRELEKRLISRLDALGYPIGVTLNLLAKIAQLRCHVARELQIENI